MMIIEWPYSDNMLHFLIEKVTDDDIQRVARRFLATPPALAARGDIRGLPDHKDIQNGLFKHTQSATSSRLSLFR